MSRNSKTAPAKPLSTLTKRNFVKCNQCQLPLSALPDVLWDDDSLQCLSFRAVHNVAHKWAGRSREPICRKPKVPLFIHLWCCSVNTPGSLYLVSPPINNAEIFTQAGGENESWVISLLLHIHQVKGTESLVTTDGEVAGNTAIGGGADHHTASQFRQDSHLAAFWSLVAKELTLLYLIDTAEA